MLFGIALGLNEPGGFIGIGLNPRAFVVLATIDKVYFTLQIVQSCNIELEL